MNLRIYFITFSKIVRLLYIQKHVTDHVRHNDTEPSLSFSQLGYLVADSLYYISRALFFLFVAVTVYLLIGIVAAYTGANIEFFKFFLPYIFVLLSFAIIWYYVRARKFYRSLKDWNEDYFEQSYMLSFDTTLPKGNTTGKKILSMSQLIFPELRSDYLSFSPYIEDYIKYFFKKLIKRHGLISKRLSYTIGSYLLDVVIKTQKGYFIVKDFKDTVVTLEDLKYFVKTVSREFKSKSQRTYIFRAICVAKSYDQSFFNREQLEVQLTKELKSKFPIDLIVEEDRGYSVLWIS